MTTRLLLWETELWVYTQKTLSGKLTTKLTMVKAELAELHLERDEAHEFDYARKLKGMEG